MTRGYENGHDTVYTACAWSEIIRGLFQRSLEDLAGGPCVNGQGAYAPSNAQQTGE